MNGRFTVKDFSMKFSFFVINIFHINLPVLKKYEIRTLKNNIIQVLGLLIN